MKAASDRPNSVLAPVALGELIDKITILEIKRSRITDPNRLANVEHEYRQLLGIWEAFASENSDVADLKNDLLAVNELIWKIEDEIRDHERLGDFGPNFVALARGVYHNNDQRAAIKREINLRLNSSIVEEKSYADYKRGA